MSFFDQPAWTFAIPTRITFGDNVAQRIRGYVAPLGRRPLVVTDRFWAEQSWLVAMAETLGKIPVFREVRPNPTIDNVDALTRQIHETGADVLVAVGGGSPIDCAKAASVLALSAEASLRVFCGGQQPLGERHLPVVAVPTTAGTGAEVTPFAVLDDTATGRKAPLASDSFYPVHAVVDPLLTHSLPLAVTAATGMDALSHALEAFWSKNHQPICDLLAQEAARLIFAHFERVCVNPTDAEARRAMSYAALLAGLAFQLPKNAIVHACSYPLSTRFHLPHGVACALTLEFAIRLNAPHLNGRLEAFAQSSGFASLNEMIAKIQKLKHLGGLPATLQAAHIPASEIETLVRESFHPLMNNNPVTVSEDDLRRMYRELDQPEK